MTQGSDFGLPRECAYSRYLNNPRRAGSNRRRTPSQVLTLGELIAGRRVDRAIPVGLQAELPWHRSRVIGEMARALRRGWSPRIARRLCDHFAAAGARRDQVGIRIMRRVVVDEVRVLDDPGNGRAGRFTFVGNAVRRDRAIPLEVADVEVDPNISRGKGVAHHLQHVRRRHVMVADGVCLDRLGGAERRGR